MTIKIDRRELGNFPILDCLCTSIQIHIISISQKALVKHPLYNFHISPCLPQILFTAIFQLNYLKTIPINLHHPFPPNILVILRHNHLPDLLIDNLPSRDSLLSIELFDAIFLIKVAVFLPAVWAFLNVVKDLESNIGIKTAAILAELLD